MQTYSSISLQSVGRGLLLAMIALLAGCPGSEKSPAGGTGLRASALLGPVAINIHDSSAIIRKKAGGDFDGIIAACEVLDRFDDSIKTTGVMRFEAYEYAPSEPENKGARIGFWPDVRIDSLESIQQHWDSIWGLYRFNLTWQIDAQSGRRYILEATLTTPDGEQFSGNHMLHASP